jgi:hypothetical protein
MVGQEGGGMAERAFDPMYWYLGILHGLKTKQQCIVQAQRVAEEEFASPVALEIAGLLLSERDRLLHIVADSSEFDESKSLLDYREQFALDAVEQYLSNEISADHLEHITTQLWLKTDRGMEGIFGALYTLVTDWQKKGPESALRDDLVALLRTRD